MSISSLLLFAAVYFAAVATPGPGVAALVARVLAHGLVGVAPFIAGYVVGDLIWLAIAATGLAVLAHEFAGVFIVLKFAGVAYLLYVAWGMARSSATLGRRRAARARRAGLARVLRLALPDARQSQGDRVLPVDHAAGRRSRRDDPGDLLSKSPRPR